MTIGAGSALLRCNYALYRTDQEGVSDCFSVGRVEATVVEEEGALRFARMRVVYDTATVPGLLVLRCDRRQQFRGHPGEPGGPGNRQVKTLRKRSLSSRCT